MQGLIFEAPYEPISDCMYIAAKGRLFQRTPREAAVANATPFM